MRLTAMVSLLACATFVLAEPDAPDAMVLEGLIQPSRIIELGFPGEGRLAVVAVERGDRVEAGQLLASLDCGVEEASLAIAEAQAKNQAELDIARVQIDHMRGKVESHRKLEEQGTISADEFREFETGLKLAELEYVRAQENRKLAELEGERLRASLRRRQIVAPCRGVVTDRHLSAGELVNVANRSAVLHVAVTDQLHVESYAPGDWFGRIRPGMQAFVEPLMKGTQPRMALVTVVDPVIDAASGTFGVQLKIDNADGAIPAGLRCTVRFE